ncbi:Uncharacterised protein [Vibrio cholerae]|uniref:Uncharacterized protein n=1 Tax=Vibrio cholerae TaxID=666 RepID=A0A655ZXS1_VIBCL|nr:Uncharacterised protein [Vibrio cholerae]
MHSRFESPILYLLPIGITIDFEQTIGGLDISI